MASIEFQPQRVTNLDRGGVHFVARQQDGDLIDCLVTQGALLDLADVGSATDAQLFAVFDRHILSIRAIAAEKIAAGAVEADGWTVITTSELNP